MSKSDDNYPFQRNFETNKEYEARILRSLRVTEANIKAGKENYISEADMEGEVDKLLRELRNKREEAQAERVANLVVKKLKQQKHATV